MSGEGAARATGDDDGRQQYAHLTQHADGDKVDGEDLCAEAGELVRALEGQDDADQKRNETHDGQGPQPRLLHLANQGDEANAAGAQQSPEQHDHRVAKKTGERRRRSDEVERRFAQAGDGEIEDACRFWLFG